MAKLDARNWMEFRIGDIFRMNNTKSIVQKDVVPDSGTVPYVTAQAGNNGVMTFIDCPPEWMDEGDCIMIGGKTLTFSYQEKAFCSNDSHNIALHLKETDKASEARYLFLITALGSSSKALFNFAPRELLSITQAKFLCKRLFRVLLKSFLYEALFLKNIHGVTPFP